MAELLRWECSYGLQFIGLEFFFRGFMVHGTRHRFGFYAVFVMMVPYCMIHYQKPMPETFGAIVAGIVLGFMSLKMRSISDGRGHSHERGPVDGFPVHARARACSPEHCAGVCARPRPTLRPRTGVPLQSARMRLKNSPSRLCSGVGLNHDDSGGSRHQVFGPVLAVDEVSFAVDKGQIVGFLGLNGAGKTTTMRILTTYLPATSGIARVAGFDVMTESMQVRKNMGYLPDNMPFYPRCASRSISTIGPS